MRLDALALSGFRSHTGASFCFAPGVNWICGQNGRGKTNLLEAVFLLSGSRSWRTALRRELIGWESPGAALSARVHTRGRDYRLEMALPRTGPMTATVNGARVSRQNPLSDVLRAVVFSPEDLGLVKGPPQGRRDFLDETLLQLYPGYRPLLARYHKLLAGKGQLLRRLLEGSARGAEALPEYDAQLARLGARILARRAGLCRQLEQAAGAVYAELSGGREQLGLSYRTLSTVGDPWADEGCLEAWIAQHQAGHQAAERQSGLCLSGVHRDDVALTLSGRPTRAFASQGQARSVALALRFAQRAIFFEDGGEPPLLLLDDVLSELDGARRAYVCRQTQAGQTLLTGCQPEPGFEGARVIWL